MESTDTVSLSSFSSSALSILQRFVSMLWGGVQDLIPNGEWIRSAGDFGATSLGTAFPIWW